MTASEKIEFLSAKLKPTRVELMRRALKWRTRRITVVLEDVFQSHNASAVLRSCDAFGIQEAHIIENRNKFIPSRNVLKQLVNAHIFESEDKVSLIDDSYIIKMDGYP